jgi:hypothetical protein
LRPELETYQLIDHFLNGELKGDVLLAFEKRMLEDASFAEEVSLQKMTNAVVIGASYDSLRTQMTNDVNKIDGSNNTKKWLGGALGGIILSTIIIASYSNDKDASVNIIENEVTNTPSVIATTTDTQFIPSKQPITNITPSNENTPAQSSRLNNLDLTDQVIIDTPKITSHPQQQIAVTPITSTANTPVQQVTPQIVIDPCKDIKIHTTISTQPSCENSNTGSIHIPSESIIGGTKPYKTTLNKTDAPKLKEVYNYLHAGDYTVYITDKNGCATTITATVEAQRCVKKTYVFSPDKGETWKIEGVANQEYTLTILNIAGNQVYKTPHMHGEFEWNGFNQNGSLLDAGLYIYVLEYTNGTKENGQVTIIR